MAARIVPDLVLASRSPRRLALLGQIGLTAEVCPVDVVENLDPRRPLAESVEELAREKAVAGLGVHVGALPVLGADTVVCLQGVVMGKPADDDEARDYLNRLSGTRHDVLTGVAIASQSQVLSCLNRTSVWFRRLEPAEIDRYVATGEPADKAGAYGIQGVGGAFVERLDGSYSGVMGLPLADTARLLARFGVLVP